MQHATETAPVAACYGCDRTATRQLHFQLVRLMSASRADDSWILDLFGGSSTSLRSRKIRIRAESRVHMQTCNGLWKCWKHSANKSIHSSRVFKPRLPYSQFSLFLTTPISKHAAKHRIGGALCQSFLEVFKECCMHVHLPRSQRRSFGSSEKPAAPGQHPFLEGKPGFQHAATARFPCTAD